MRLAYPANPALPPVRERADREYVFCGSCGGMIGGDWSTGGCTCGLSRDDPGGGYGPNHR